MLDFWTELPAWLRILSAIGLMLLGGALVLFVSIKLGFALVGLGFVLVLIGGKSSSEKNGYRF